MKVLSHLLAVVSALAVAWLAHAWAQDTEDSGALENDQIEITYVEPSSPELMRLYESMKERRVLEQLKEFLSPLILPLKLKMRMEECGPKIGANAFWSGRSEGLIICYEFLAFVESVAPEQTTAEGFTRDDAITGGLLQVVFHELGHGLFDIYSIPVLGREEDGADQMAAVVLSQMGPEVARRTLPAAAYLWQKFGESRGDRPYPFWDEHGHDLQRAYNYLCIAYASDPETSAYYLESGLLPNERAEHCEREVNQIVNAFEKTVLPYIDGEKMEAVRNRRWLPAVIWGPN